MSELCHRCQRELPSLAGAADGPHTRDNVLLFCPHCAAPQIRLPEYSQTQHPLAASTGSMSPPVPDSRADGSPAFTQAPPHVNWRIALQVCALVAAVTAVADLIAVISNDTFGAVAAFIAQLLNIGGAGLSVGLYAQLAPRNHLTSRRGLSIGFVTGLLIIAVSGLMLSGVGVVARFVFHNGLLDTSMNSFFAGLAQTWTAAGEGQPDMQPTLRSFIAALALPEVRASIGLMGAALEAVIIVLFSSFSGAAAGFIRTPRRRAMR